MSTPASTRSRAQDLMKKRRFDDAIAVYRRHLREQPDDTSALLELGICHLLNRSEREFLHIHDQAARVLASLEHTPADVVRLWSTYRSLVTKVTATALVVGSPVLSACDRGTTTAPDIVADPSHVTSTAEPTGAEPTGPSATEPQFASSPDTAPTASATTSTTDTRPTTTRPAHRYSGGVYRPPRPKPLHRYSGGAFDPPPPEPSRD